MFQKGVMQDKDNLVCWKFNGNTAFPSYKCIFRIKDDDAHLPVHVD